MKKTALPSCRIILFCTRVDDITDNVNILCNKAKYTKTAYVELHCTPFSSLKI